MARLTPGVTLRERARCYSVGFTAGTLMPSPAWSAVMICSNMLVESRKSVGKTTVAALPLLAN